MNLPIQSQPVIRKGNTPVIVLNGLTPQGCGVLDWVKCGAIAAGCAAACVVTEGEACIECLGPAYDSCKDCL
ncbi:hypothetical protein [Okeania sp. KiyG1]|uniref:hypothetical protein n=1 Tax=Okeania sp. KiyG1 TaxID=2720165 RepID=UPI0019214563|nr:hypothetical protein [Okeania sp. KiyG1]GGA18698.1 hypothetical protein CYANOKiyG1_33200 [Okeania sp. KiyG1]